MKMFGHVSGDKAIDRQRQMAGDGGGRLASDANEQSRGCGDGGQDGVPHSSIHQMRGHHTTQWVGGQAHHQDAYE